MEPLEILLDLSQSREARVTACAALAGTEDPRAVAAMLGVMDGFGEVDEAVGAALRETPIARELLLGWLAVPYDEVPAYAAVWALGRIGLDEASVEALRRTLWFVSRRDREALAAQCAAEVLGDHKVRRTLPDLLALGNAVRGGAHRVGYPERLLQCVVDALVAWGEPRALGFVMAQHLDVLTWDGQDDLLEDAYYRLSMAMIDSGAGMGEAMEVLGTIEALCRRQEPTAVELLLWLARTQDEAEALLRSLVETGAIEEDVFLERVEYAGWRAWEDGIDAFLALWWRWPEGVRASLNETLEDRLRESDALGGAAPEGTAEALVRAFGEEPSSYMLLDVLEHDASLVPKTRDALEALARREGDDALVSLALTLGRAGARDARLLTLAVELLSRTDAETQLWALDVIEGFDPLPQAAYEAIAAHPNPEVRGWLDS